MASFSVPSWRGWVFACALTFALTSSAAADTLIGQCFQWSVYQSSATSRFYAVDGGVHWPAPERIFVLRTSASLNGTVAADLILGSPGDDILSGGDGDDYICGGEGNDQISGNIGNDFVAGNAGHDIVGGGQGNDDVRGGQGDDTVNGGVGDDNLRGGAGADNVNGGDGNDTCDSDPSPSQRTGCERFIDNSNPTQTPTGTPTPSRTPTRGIPSTWTPTATRTSTRYMMTPTATRTATRWYPATTPTRAFTSLPTRTATRWGSATPTRTASARSTVPPTIVVGPVPCATPRGSASLSLTSFSGTNVNRGAMNGPIAAGMLRNISGVDVLVLAATTCIQDPPTSTMRIVTIELNAVPQIQVGGVYPTHPPLNFGEENSAIVRYQEIDPNGNGRSWVSARGGQVVVDSVSSSGLVLRMQNVSMAPSDPPHFATGTFVLHGMMTWRR